MVETSFPTYQYQKLLMYDVIPLNNTKWEIIKSSTVKHLQRLAYYISVLFIF